MVTVADVVVVGGGCMGASIAYHLARANAGRVVLLEKGYLAGGPTGKSSAVVRQHYTIEQWVQTSQRALDIFANFNDIIGGDPGFVHTGFVACFGPDDVAAVEANVAMQREYGVNVTLITPHDLKALLPHAYVDDLATIAYHPDTGYADSIRTTGAFATRARDLGVAIYEGVTALRLQVVSGRISGVETDQGTIATGCVVNAAGAWGGQLVRDLAVDLPITPTRHPICLFHRPPDAEAEHPVISDPLMSAYYRPSPGKMTLVGAAEAEYRTRPVDADGYDQGIHADEIAYFKARITHRLPAMARCIMRGGYAGVYDTTPDDQPILGPIEDVAGLWLCLGWSGHGFKHSPVMGELLSQWVMEGRTDIDLLPFQVGRFAQGALVRGRYEYGSGFKR